MNPQATPHAYSLLRVFHQQKAFDYVIILPNNTPQAYLPVHRHDAQTGGLIFCAAALQRSPV